MKLQDSSESIKIKLNQEVYKMKNLIRYSNIVTHDLQHNIERLNANLSEIIDAIVKRSEMLPAGGEEGVVEALMAEIRDEHDIAEIMLREKIEEFNQYIAGSKTSIIKTEHFIDSADDDQISEQGQSIVDSILAREMALPLCLDKRCLYVLTPIPELNGDEVLTSQQILGEFSKQYVPWRIEVKRLNCFRPDDVSARVVTTMCAGESGLVWVVWQWGPRIHLVSKTGDVHKVIDLGCKMDGICSLREGMAVSCHMDKCVKVLNKQHEVIQTFNTDNIPRGIHANSFNEVIICGVQNMHRKNNDVSTISKMNIDSGEITVLPCSEKLVQPCRVSVNNTDDICVSDRNKGSVMLFDQTGSLKAEYTGPDSSTRHPFGPEAVRCDRFGQILVVDYTNHTVHVLDPIGRFRGFLIMDTEMEKRAIFMGTSGPFSLTIDTTGDLWVGNKFGYLTILKYDF